jgi:hypothetical protein
MLHTVRFFYLKGLLLHNATFLIHILFSFYIEGGLKFKSKNPVPKRLINMSYGPADLCFKDECPSG